MRERNRAHDDQERERDPARIAEPVSSESVEDELGQVRGEHDSPDEQGLAKGADEDEQRFDAG